MHLRVGSKTSHLFSISEKETRCCHILCAKCPLSWGLLQTDHEKLFLNGPLATIDFSEELIIADNTFIIKFGKSLKKALGRRIGVVGPLY